MLMLSFRPYFSRYLKFDCVSVEDTAPFLLHYIYLPEVLLIKHFFMKYNVILHLGSSEVGELSI